MVTSALDLTDDVEITRQILAYMDSPLPLKLTSKTLSRNIDNMLNSMNNVSESIDNKVLSADGCELATSVSLLKYNMDILHLPVTLTWLCYCVQFGTLEALQYLYDDESADNEQYFDSKLITALLPNFTTLHSFGYVNKQYEERQMEKLRFLLYIADQKDSEDLQLSIAENRGTSPRDNHKRHILSNSTYIEAARTCNIRLMSFLLQHSNEHDNVSILQDQNIVSSVLLSSCTELQILIMLKFLNNDRSDDNDNDVSTAILTKIGTNGSGTETAGRARVVRFISPHLTLACKLGFLQICKYLRSLPAPIPLAPTFLAHACQVTEYTARNHLRGCYVYQSILDEYHKSEAAIRDITVTEYLEQTGRGQYGGSSNSSSSNNSSASSSHSLNEQFVDFATFEIEKEGMVMIPDDSSINHLLANGNWKGVQKLLSLDYTLQSNSINSIIYYYIKSQVRTALFGLLG